MTRFSLFFTILLTLWRPAWCAASDEFIALAYHDVVETRAELTYDAITLDNLIDHFEWIKANGYHPVSLDDLIAARDGERPLPEKSLLLCWDDAYVSFHRYVLPLLKAYNYPAILALVGTWMQAEAGETVQYGDETVPRGNFMSWEQVREARATGLVEIASHSYALHQGVVAGREGGTLPAAVALEYYPDTGRYESMAEYRRRILADLQASRRQIRRQVGEAPRALVWPFGRYNAVTLALAEEAGFTSTLTLDPVPARLGRLNAISRIYPTLNPDVARFRAYLSPAKRQSPTRLLEVASRDLLEPSAGREEHFSAFLDRVKILGPSLVLLDPLVRTEEGLGALFRTDRYPLVQDRLKRISWHTGKRAGTAVFLRLSSFLFEQGPEETAAEIERFFSELGQAGYGDGLVVDYPELLHALLEEPARMPGEEAVVFWNPEKRRRARQTILEKTVNPVVAESFSALETFQKWQPFQQVSASLSLADCKTLDGRDFARLLSFFDFLIIEAGAGDPEAIGNTLEVQLRELHDTNLLRKCVFTLAMEGRAERLPEMLQALPELNIISWGYRYDDFLRGMPALERIRPLTLVKSFPYPLR